MQELAERRRFPRLSIRLPFLFRLKSPDLGKAGTGWTYDLSEEGACLELTDRMEAQSTLRLLLQTDQGALDLSVTVIWAAAMREAGRGVLHGVSFSGLTPDQRQALGELLRVGGR
jgi:hypothetical protein